jgi:hypothetical protein
MWAPFCDDYTINLPKKKLPRLENWYITEDSHGQIIWGNVYGDSRYNSETTEFQDSHLIRTSYIVELNESEGWCQTTNTLYKLGKRRILDVNDYKI